MSSSMFGSAEGLTIRELPRWLNMGLYSYEIEGDPKLLNTEVGGDWIVREDVPAEQLIQPLEAILQRAIRQRITLALRRVERDVVVARGRYRHSPLPGHADGEIEIYARELDQDDDRASGAGVLPAFLNWTAEWIGRPIVNEVESPPKAKIVWHHGRRGSRSHVGAQTSRGADRAYVHAGEKTDADPVRRADSDIQIVHGEDRTDPRAWI